jgi:hypothetical protein
MLSPTILFPVLGVVAWSATGVLTYGTPVFWVWLLESVGVVIMGSIALKGLRA